MSSAAEEPSLCDTLLSQSGVLYNVVHSIHCIYYVTLYNLVQLLYNYVYCDLPY